MKQLISLLFGVFVLMSCSDSTDTMVGETSKANSYFISQDSAIVLANKAVASITGNLGDATRGVEGRKVKSVSVVNDVLTSRAASDNGISKSLYIVNYENEKGFAVVASDKRLQPIYAVSDSGSLNIRDTIENKGLALFFSGVQYDMARTSSNSPTIAVGPNNQNYVYGAQVSPLISSNTRKWGQDNPYNKYCPLVSGKRSFVGCAPVACAIIMSYYMWPKKITDFSSGFYDINLPWRSMKNGGANDKVAFLFSELGSQNLLKTKYSSNEAVGSTSCIDSIAPTFLRMGYLNPKKFELFDSGEICEILDDAQKGTTENCGDGPVLISASDVMKGAHIWVIDGYAKNPVDVDGTKWKQILYHCVWGYNNGLNNGYFYFNEKGQLGGIAGYFNVEDTGGNKDVIPSWYKGLLYMTKFQKNSKYVTGEVEI